MVEIVQTEIFADWIGSLKDAKAQAIIAARIDRARFGNLGDTAPVGKGVSEMRIHYGPGYRLYFVQRGTIMIVLLCGGDKSTQKADIRAAHKIAKQIED